MSEPFTLDQQAGIDSRYLNSHHGMIRSFPGISATSTYRGCLGLGPGRSNLNPEATAFVPAEYNDVGDYREINETIGASEVHVPINREFNRGYEVWREIYGGADPYHVYLPTNPSFPWDDQYKLGRIWEEASLRAGNIRKYIEEADRNKKFSEQKSELLDDTQNQEERGENETFKASSIGSGPPSPVKMWTTIAGPATICDIPPAAQDNLIAETQVEYCTPEQDYSSLLRELREHMSFWKKVPTGPKARGPSASAQSPLIAETQAQVSTDQGSSTVGGKKDNKVSWAKIVAAPKSPAPPPSTSCALMPTPQAQSSTTARSLSPSGGDTSTNKPPSWANILATPVRPNPPSSTSKHSSAEDEARSSATARLSSPSTDGESVNKPPSWANILAAPAPKIPVPPSSGPDFLSTEDQAQSTATIEANPPFIGSKSESLPLSWSDLGDKFGDTTPSSQHTHTETQISKVPSQDLFTPISGESDKRFPSLAGVTSKNSTRSQSSLAPSDLTTGPQAPPSITRKTLSATLRDKVKRGSSFADRASGKR